MSKDVSNKMEYKRLEDERLLNKHHASVIKDKISAVTKMRKVYNMLREENDNIVKLKALSPSGQLPAGILRKGAEAIAEAVSTFEKAREADLENMRLPKSSERKRWAK